MAYLAARLLTGKSIVPVLEFGGSSAGVTFTATPSMRIGVLSVEDQILQVDCRMQLTSKGAGSGADEVSITGLEYPGETGVHQIIPCALANTTTDLHAFAQILSGATSIQLWMPNGSGSIRRVIRDDFTNNTTINLSGTYRLAE